MNSKTILAHCEHCKRIEPMIIMGNLYSSGVLTEHPNTPEEVARQCRETILAQADCGALINYHISQLDSYKSKTLLREK